MLSPDNYSAGVDEAGNIEFLPDFHIGFTVPNEPTPFAVGDINGDRRVSDSDLALLNAVIKVNLQEEDTSWQAEFIRRFRQTCCDLNQDQRVDSADAEVLATKHLDWVMGDLDDDGDVDATDFELLGQQAYGGRSDWKSGDYDLDGVFTTADLVRLFEAGVPRAWT